MKDKSIKMTNHANTDLSFDQIIEAVKQLSPREKLILNDVLWNESMQIPEEHQMLVLGRIKKAKQNPNRLLDWDEAAKTLKS